MSGYLSSGLIIFTIVVLVSNIKVLLISFNFSLLMVLAIAFSFVSYSFCVFVLNIWLNHFNLFYGIASRKAVYYNSTHGAVIIFILTIGIDFFISRWACNFNSYLNSIFRFLKNG